MQTIDFIDQMSIPLPICHALLVQHGVQLSIDNISIIMEHNKALRFPKIRHAMLETTLSTLDICRQQRLCQDINEQYVRLFNNVMSHVVCPVNLLTTNA